MRIIAFFVSLFVIGYICFSCTLSFQNTSTNGEASDVIDEDQDASPEISPNIEVPFPVLI